MSSSYLASSRAFGSPPTPSPSPSPAPGPTAPVSSGSGGGGGGGGPPHYAVPPDIRAIINDRSWLHDESGGGPGASSSVKYIVGIDYGTTFSGFGLHVVTDRPTLTRNGYPTGPVIKCYDNWEMQPPGLFSPKLPTISTYSRADADGAFPAAAKPSSTTDATGGSKLTAWGWRAASDFSGKDHKLALAKLALHPDTPPHRRPFIPAGLDLVQIVADYLRELVGVVRSLAPGVGQVEGETVWCFTVPVNWNAAAMDVMRQAAHRAGLIASPTSRMLRFCEEPEAAALTCLEESGIKMAPGARFLVVDAGGGTVDLFQCTLDSAGSLDEITVGAGDFLGASFVDARFYSFLRTHLGDDTWESLTTSPSLANTWRDMEARWENLKRTYRGPPASAADATNHHEVLTFSLSLYKQIPGEYKRALRDRQGTDDELWVTAQDMQSFFDPVVSAIRTMVLDQLRAAPGGAIDHVFFVGGFGANRYLQSALMDDPEIQSRVRHPVAQQIRQPESAVLKGAVRYGMDRGKIRTRMAKHTLALLVHVNANALPLGGKHDSGLVTINGQTYLVLVRRGEAVRYESLVTHSHLALGDASTTGVVKIFEIDGCLDGDKHAGSEPCPSPRLVGRITVTAPLTPGVKRRVTLLVNFGELELKMRAVSEVTGQEWRVTVQYDVTQDRQVGGGGGGGGSNAGAGASSLTSLAESMSTMSVADSSASASPDLAAARRGSIPLHPSGGTSPSPVHQPVVLNPPARSASASALSSSPNLNTRSIPPPSSAPHPGPNMPAAPSPLAVAQAMQQGDSSAANRPFVIPVRETSVAHAPPPTAGPLQSPPPPPSHMPSSSSSSFGRQPTFSASPAYHPHHPSATAPGAPPHTGYYGGGGGNNSWPRHQHHQQHHAPQHVFAVPDEQHMYPRSPPQPQHQHHQPANPAFPPPRTAPIYPNPAGASQPYPYPSTAAAGGSSGYGGRHPVLLPGVPDPPILPPVLPHQLQPLGARPSVVVQRSEGVAQPHRQYPQQQQQQQQHQQYPGVSYYGGQGQGGSYR